MLQVEAAEADVFVVANILNAFVAIETTGCLLEVKPDLGDITGSEHELNGVADIPAGSEAEGGLRPAMSISRSMAMAIMLVKVR